MKTRKYYCQEFSCYQIYKIVDNIICVYLVLVHFVHKCFVGDNKEWIYGCRGQVFKIMQSTTYLLRLEG